MSFFLDFLIGETYCALSDPERKRIAHFTQIKQILKRSNKFLKNVDNYQK